MARQNGKNQKPNILVMWGDDIGITNLSCYSDGLMGYETPNIDRLAKEGLRFLHYRRGRSHRASIRQLFSSRRYTTSRQ